MAYYIQRGSWYEWERREVEELEVKMGEMSYWSIDVVEGRRWKKRMTVNVIWDLCDSLVKWRGYIYYITQTL